MRTITLLWAAGLVLLARGAAAQDVNYDYDRHASFAAYRTYAWVGGTTLAADDLKPGLVDLPIVARRRMARRMPVSSSDGRP